MRKHRIEFTVEQDQYKEIKEYALKKWHGTPAGLARFALGQYMSRYKLTSADTKNAVTSKSCTAQAADSNIKEVSE